MKQQGFQQQAFVADRRRLHVLCEIELDLVSVSWVHVLAPDTMTLLNVKHAKDESRAV